MNSVTYQERHTNKDFLNNISLFFSTYPEFFLSESFLLFFLEFELFFPCLSPIELFFLTKLCFLVESEFKQTVLSDTTVCFSTSLSKIYFIDDYLFYSFIKCKNKRVGPKFYQNKNFWEKIIGLTGDMQWKIFNIFICYINLLFAL